MKKLSFILLLLLNGAVLFGQTKPTKQETIDWIIAKIRENPRIEDIRHPGVYYTYSITDDYKIKCSLISQRKVSFTNTVTFSFNDICSASFNENFKAISVTFKSPIKSKSDDGTTDEEDSWEFFINPSATNMGERMLKAFRTLAEYNCPPVKEIF